jgi:hypothetical protein
MTRFELATLTLARLWQPSAVSIQSVYHRPVKRAARRVRRVAAPSAYNRIARCTTTEHVEHPPDRSAPTIGNATLVPLRLRRPCCLQPREHCEAVQDPTAQRDQPRRPCPNEETPTTNAGSRVVQSRSIAGKCATDPIARRARSVSAAIYFCPPVANRGCPLTPIRSQCVRPRTGGSLFAEGRRSLCGAA